MQPKTTYSLRQIAQMLRTSPATIQQYIRDFSGYLSPSARKKGKDRGFTKNDLVVLGRIRKYKSERKPTVEIKTLLKIPAKQKGSLADRIDIPARFRKKRPKK